MCWADLCRVVERGVGLWKNIDMDKPVMRSITEFVDYLAVHLGLVRVMRRLSRDEAYLVLWDKVMGERWVSVINGNCPTPEQRRAALEERANVANLLPRVQVAVRELVPRLHSLHAYCVSLALPAAASATPGWAVREDMLHPDSVIKMLSAALDDAKGLRALDEGNACFKELLDQLLEMARWTRTSLNPTPADREKVRLGGYTVATLDAELREALGKVCRRMHDFCELYAGFPVLPPKVQIQLEPLKLGENQQ